jgi:hypothetical protein
MIDCDKRAIGLEDFLVTFVVLFDFLVLLLRLRLLVADWLDSSSYLETFASYDKEEGHPTCPPCT